MENKVAENTFKNRVLAQCANRLEDGAITPQKSEDSSYLASARTITPGTTLAIRR